MILTGVRLENFGPFFRKHTLSLQVTRTAPVILIHGENMRGKTSLLNAIRWCLYGTAQGRAGRKKDAFRLLSYDAIDEGDFHMSVVLDFEHDKHEYQLERHVQWSTRPNSDDGLAATLHLRQDGHFVPENQISGIIGNILHRDISQFFLFDGEMLDEFEVLLFTPGRDADLVRESIEQILGLPALNLAVSDLDQLHRSAESRQLKAVKLSKKNEGRVAQAQQVQSDIESLERDLAGLRTKKADLESSKSELQQRRDQFSEIQGDVRQIEQLEEAAASLTGAIKQGQEECRELVSEAWFEVVAPKVASTLGELDGAMQRESKAIESASDARLRVSMLEDAIKNEVCPICGAQHHGAETHKLRERLEKILKAIPEESRAANRIGDLQAQISRLRPFASRERLILVTQMLQAVKVNEIALHKNQREAEAIRTRIKGHDRSEIKKTETDFERVVGILSHLNQDIEGRENALKAQMESLTRIQQDIARLPEADQRIATEAAVYAFTRDTFRGAIEDFRERLRKDVEREATGIFKVLTTEKHYEKLLINPQYGLSIVDDRGKSIYDRSAGAEQIVALSLIGALNRCATRVGPVIMDTPFGRLDQVHRENILHFVPELAPQVLLLVQSGEFDRKRDGPHLKGKVAHEYRIVRDGTPTKSKFEVVQAGDSQ